MTKFDINDQSQNPVNVKIVYNYERKNYSGFCVLIIFFLDALECYKL